MPLSVTCCTVQVTTSPCFSFSVLPAKGSSPSCLMPRLTRSLSTSTSSTLTLTTSPLLYCLAASSPDRFQSRSERRSEEHTSEFQSLMRISYDDFCLKKKTNNNKLTQH